MPFTHWSSGVRRQEEWARPERGRPAPGTRVHLCQCLEKLRERQPPNQARDEICSQLALLKSATSPGPVVMAQVPQEIGRTELQAHPLLPGSPGRSVSSRQSTLPSVIWLFSLSPLLTHTPISNRLSENLGYFSLAGSFHVDPGPLFSIYAQRQ